VKILKEKKCKQCKSLFKPMNSLQQVCNYVCAVALNRQKEIDKKIAKFKVNLETPKQLKPIAKKIAQQYARLRDKDLPCISCGSPTAIEWHGGHLYKAELWSGVLFDEYNINKQCKKCNVFLDGNESGYVEGFIKRYGFEKLQELMKRKNESKSYKWTRDELKEKIEYFKQKVKDLRV
jgi:hypothetical protein